MSFRWDFLVLASDGHPRVLVEAKRTLGTDDRWAARFRARLLESSPGAVATPMMIVVPDRIYVWSANVAANAAPSRSLAGPDVLGPYFENAEADPTRIDPQVFEDLVAWWLRDVAEGRRPGSWPLEEEFHLAGGQVIREIAA